MSTANSERLIKVRLDHPIARCMELADALRERFGLSFVEVVPTDPGNSNSSVGVASAAATEIEKRLASVEPIIMALGTGRALKAAIEQLSPMQCPHHAITSFTGNVAPIGSASFFNVIFHMADVVKAHTFPMPLPVLAKSSQERELLHQQAMISATLELVARADVTFVGIASLAPAR